MDRNTGRGPPERNRQTKEAMAEPGAQEAMAVQASVPSARPLQPEPFYPPKKISLGKLGGIRSPPGLNRQDSTWIALQG